MSLKIKTLFKNRCLINPSHKGTVIHHIIPKAHGSESDDEENTVLLCGECHNLIHKDGASAWKDRLIKLRNDWIEKYGN